MSDEYLVLWARRVLVVFAVAGALHVPAFYYLVWDLTKRADPPLIEACPAPRTPTK